MDRRGFLLGLAGALGAAATAGSVLTSAAEATPLDQLKSLAPQSLAPPDPVDAATPDGTPVEETQYWGPPGPPRGRYWRRSRRRSRRRVCGWRRDRWGRRYRSCWYVWR